MGIEEEIAHATLILFINDPAIQALGLGLAALTAAAIHVTKVHLRFMRMFGMPLSEKQLRRLMSNTLLGRNRKSADTPDTIKDGDVTYTVIRRKTPGLNNG